MITLDSHGTMTSASSTLTNWRAAVDAIVCSRLTSSVEEIDETITRERLARWYADGMTVAMASSSVASWIRTARPGKRADREVASLKRMLASVPICPGCEQPAHASESDDDNYHAGCRS